MQFVLRACGRVARAFLPPKWMRILRSPALLPSYYMRFAREIESIIDLGAADEDPDYLAGMLRKYAHIIDKGLQRRDFEPGHSRHWYEKAVVVINKLGSEGVSDPSLVWAKRKVAEYESRQKGESAWNPGLPQPACSPELEALMQVIRGRRSARRYSGRKVERAKLLAIAEAINWSPTSCNRQPAKVFATIDSELVRRCSQACSGATCFSGEGACFLSFCADLRFYDLPEEAMTPDLDIGLGVQNCLLVAHTLGLNVTLLSWARHSDADERSLRQLLSIQPHHRIVVNALMGYAEAVGECPGRKALDSTLNIVDSTGDAYS